MRRLRLVVGVVALGFVLAVALGSAGLLGGGRALGSSTTLTIIGGDVAVRHGVGGQFVAGVDGEVLSGGDAVRTGADARAVLTYFEGSTVTIEPGTELAIDTTATRGSDTIVQMTQSVGRTWHVVSKLVAGESKYEVRTPASTASVRGTSFEVNTDGTTTTIATTEGTVVSLVPNPQDPGRSLEVPVGPGQQHRQTRGAAPGGSEQSPEPERKVTITLTEENTIVIDTLGRANGIDQNGKTHLQTPGAKLERIDGRLVITLPNIPDGRLQALVRKEGGGQVDVTTVVTERGRSTTSNGRVDADANTGQARAAVTIGGGRSGEAPTVEQTQAPSPSPSPSQSAAPTQAAGGGSGGGGAGGGTTGGGQGQGPGQGPGQGGQGQGGQGQGGQGQGGQGQGGQGQGQGGPPSPTPGFVPATALPTIPTGGATPTPKPGQGGGGQGTGGGAGQGGQGTGGGGGNSGGGGGAGGPPSPRRP